MEYDLIVSDDSVFLYPSSKITEEQILGLQGEIHTHSCIVTSDCIADIKDEKNELREYLKELKTELDKSELEFSSFKYQDKKTSDDEYFKIRGDFITKGNKYKESLERYETMDENQYKKYIPLEECITIKRKQNTSYTLPSKVKINNVWIES